MQEEIKTKEGRERDTWIYQMPAALKQSRAVYLVGLCICMIFSDNVVVRERARLFVVVFVSSCTFFLLSRRIDNTPFCDFVVFFFSRRM